MNDNDNILSAELAASLPANAVYEKPKKKKKKKKKNKGKTIPLQKGRSKSRQKKLDQIAKRKLMKRKRNELFKSLNENSLSQYQQSLLVSTEVIGRGGMTSKEQANFAYMKKKAGLKYDDDILNKNSNSLTNVLDEEEEEITNDKIKTKTDDNPFVVNFTITNRNKKNKRKRNKQPQRIKYKEENKYINYISRY